MLLFLLLILQFVGGKVYVNNPHYLQEFKDNIPTEISNISRKELMYQEVFLKE
jgi:hypothetical protein